VRRGLLAASLAAALAAPAGAEEAPDLVTVVTSEHPQTQLMAMVLTAQAVEQGRSVHMLLCGPGGDIALRDAPETAIAGQPPRDMSPQGLLQRIMAGGATVEVCAIYLPGKGLEADALLDGVTVAEPPAMAARMLGETTAVWSF
jgi:intracellular sulfur oxidation DsrE/DsrF family protein